MDLHEWAKREIEIACARERGDNPEGEWDYGCACYESALKAFDSLLEDGHSGMSISITKHILMRLIDGKPLTPIEDTEDAWDLRYRSPDRDCTTYQCLRMSSLFKDVYDDGTVKYSDVDRVYCVSADNPDITYKSSLVRKLINEMFPITMPYMPGKAIEVHCEDFLTDRKNGDFDTVHIKYCVKDGKEIAVDRYFKKGVDDLVEIDQNEFFGRLCMHNSRERMEKEASE